MTHTGPPRLTQARLAELSTATGFSVLFDMMRDAATPAVGHNLMFDLGHCMQVGAVAAGPGSAPGVM